MSIFVGIPNSLDCLFDYHGNHVFQHNEFLFVGPKEQVDTHKKKLSFTLVSSLAVYDK